MAVPTVVDIRSVVAAVVVSMRESGVRTANRIRRSSIAHVALVRAPQCGVAPPSIVLLRCRRQERC